MIIRIYKGPYTESNKAIILDESGQAKEDDEIVERWLSENKRRWLYLWILREYNSAGDTISLHLLKCLILKGKENKAKREI